VEVTNNDKHTTVRPLKSSRYKTRINLTARAAQGAKASSKALQWPLAFSPSKSRQIVAGENDS
jgi:hypothetical protein